MYTNKWTSLLAGILMLNMALEGAEIGGRVQDPEFGTYLEGADVSLAGTGLGTTTERGGEFRIRNVAPGRYTLRVSYLGYQTLNQTVVVEGDEQRLFLPLQMPAMEVLELEAFEVTGSAIGSAKALNQKRAAPNLREIVSSDAFGKFVDRNPAEALQRVVGISTQEDQGEGKFLIIRGADPSLSTIAVDGVVPATPEENGRSTALNIISIDQLEKIEVQKTWLPDDWAHFVGGSVNLITRSALDREEGFGQVGFAIGRYENQKDEESMRFNASYGNSWAWGEEKNRRLGFQLTVDWSEDNRGSDTLDVDGWDPDMQPEVLQPKQGFIVQGISLEDYQITRERQGLSSKVEFEINRNHRWYVSFSYNQFDDDEVLQDTHLDPSNATQDYTGPLVLTEARALELGYNLSDPAVAKRVYGSTLDARRLTFDEAVKLGPLTYDDETKTFVAANFLGDAEKDLRSTITEDRIMTGQLGGRHRFFDVLTVDYNIYQSEADKEWNAKRVRLETTTVDYFIEMVEDRPVITDTSLTGKVAAAVSYRMNDDYGQIQNNYFSSEDLKQGGELNALLESEWFGWKWETKIGGAADLREKEFLRDFNQYSRIELGQQYNILTLADSPFYGGEHEELYGAFLPDYGDYLFGPRYDVEGTRAFIDDPGDVQFVQIDDDRTLAITDAALRNYAATEDITAAYLMESLKIGNWDFVAGLRWEKTDNTFTTNRVITKRADLAPEVQAVLPASLTFIQPRFWSTLFKNFGIQSVIRPETTERSYDNLLYALHATRRFGEKWVARAAVTKTIARPRYTDLVPREIVGISGARFGASAELPNFDLRPMESVNFDVSLSYFLESFGIASIAVYHKQLDGPIYDEIQTLLAADPTARELTSKYYANPNDNIDWSTQRKVNAGDGTLTGVEISFEKRFTELPAPFDGLGLFANATFIDSEVELLAEQRVGEKVPLFLQSDKLANLSVFYEKYNFLVKLSWVYRGKYLNDSLVTGDFIRDLVNKLDLPANSLDQWIAPYSRFDFLIEYRPRMGLVLFIEGNNFLNEPLERYLGIPGHLSSLQYTEPVYFAGIRYSF